MEPPATTILSGPSAPDDMVGRLAQLGFHQVRGDGAGKEADAIDKHGRNAGAAQKIVVDTACSGCSVLAAGTQGANK
jgi:hypothetical protein